MLNVLKLYNKWTSGALNIMHVIYCNKIAEKKSYETEIINWSPMPNIYTYKIKGKYGQRYKEYHLISNSRLPLKKSHQDFKT